MAVRPCWCRFTHRDIVAASKIFGDGDGQRKICLTPGFAAGGLAQVGAGFGDVVKLTFFVLNVADLPTVRAARDAVIDTAKPLASTAVQVAALFAPGYVLEVDAGALVDD
jgi:enamine deaminase RidA (YjgF/YER057c/UK114 family)